MEKQWLWNQDQDQAIRGSGTQHVAIWLRDLVNDGGEWEEAGCHTQQIAQKNITYLLEGQDYKQEDMGKDGQEGMGNGWGT